MPDDFTNPLQDPDLVAERIEDYFESRVRSRTIKQRMHGKETEFEEQYRLPPTMAGLALHLGTTRMTIWRYMKKGEDEFRCYSLIARAMERIAEFAEEALYTKEGVTGARFSLEVNHRYGKEDENGGGGAFNQTIIAPVANQGGQQAIPIWNGEKDE